MKDGFTDTIRTLLRKEIVAIRFRIDGANDTALRKAYLADLETMEGALKTLDRMVDLT